MTCSIVWNTGNEILFVADSAQTSSSKHSSSVTTFGEAHVSIKKSTGKELYVEESLFKIFQIEPITFIYAGSVGSSLKISEQLFSNVSQYNTSEDAVSNTLFQLSSFFHLFNLETGASFLIECIFAYHFEDRLRIDSYLYSMESKKMVFTPDDTREFFMIGSLDREGTNYLDKTVRVARMIPKHWKADKKLACLLALLQSYGVHDQLLLQSVGGAFAGAYLDKFGAHHWQPDLIYLCHESPENMNGPQSIFRVITLIREGFFMVKSSFNDTNNKMFFNPPNGQLESITRKLVDRMTDVADSIMHEGKFDFAVLLNKSRNSLIIIEMKQHRQHWLFRIENYPNEQKTSFHFPKEVKIYMNRSAPKNLPQDIPFILFAPYFPPLLGVPKEVIPQAII